MRKFSSKYNVKYNIETKDKTISKNKGVCFSSIINYYDFNEIEYVEIFDINCKETFEHKDDYLNYIGEMLHLEYEIKKNSFRFKAVPEKTANLCICAMVRMLWEGENNQYLEQFLLFFNNLNKGKCKYRNKLARYCYFYSLMEIDYMAIGHHLCEPEEIKIKYYKDFKKWANGKVERSINSFFQFE